MYIYIYIYIIHNYIDTYYIYTNLSYTYIIHTPIYTICTLGVDVGYDIEWYWIQHVLWALLTQQRYDFWNDVIGHKSCLLDWGFPAAMDPYDDGGATCTWHHGSKQFLVQLRRRHHPCPFQTATPSPHRWPFFWVGAMEHHQNEPWKRAGWVKIQNLGPTGPQIDWSIVSTISPPLQICTYIYIYIYMCLCT